MYRMKGGHKLHMDPLELNTRISSDITEIVLEDDNIYIPELRELVMKDDHVFQNLQTFKKELLDGEVNVLDHDNESVQISRGNEEMEDLQKLVGHIVYKMRIINPSHGHEEWLNKFLEMCDKFDSYHPPKYLLTTHGIVTKFAGFLKSKFPNHT